MSEILGFNQHKLQTIEEEQLIKFYIQNAINFLEYPATVVKGLDLFRSSSESLADFLENNLRLSIYVKNKLLGYVSLSLYDIIKFGEDEFTTYSEFVKLLKSMVESKEILHHWLKQLNKIEFPTGPIPDISNLEITQTYSLLEDNYEVKVRGHNYTELLDELDTVKFSIIDCINAANLSAGLILDALNEADYDEIYNILWDTIFHMDGITTPGYTYKSANIRFLFTTFAKNNMDAFNAYTNTEEAKRDPRIELKAKFEVSNIISALLNPSALLQPTLRATEVRV